MRPGKSQQSIPRQKWIVVSILAGSLLLRWILILRGGQYYIADETRYEVSRDAARLLAQGQVGEALKQLAISPEHIGFKVVGIVPALIEQITGPSLAGPAMYFSLFSVLNLYLIFILSQRTSRSSTEPIFTLILAACSHSLLYYSRHLFPYDLSMSFGLLALYAVLAGKNFIKSSLICGGLSFLCFITYNGYWAWSAFVLLANILFSSETITRLLQKTLVTAIGFLTPLALLIFVMLGAGTDMISLYRLFATSITQGNFQEGWSLPFEYFWHAEYLFILILAILSIIAIIRPTKEQRPIVTLWASGIMFIYICLFVSSVILQEFVVYGRLARQMIPFLILLAANGLTQMEQGKFAKYRLSGIVLSLAMVQAAWNFGLSYQLYYPRQVTEDLQAQFPRFEFSTKRLAYGAPTVCQSGGYAIENAKYFLGAPDTTQPIAGESLWEAPHPLNFLPYQYEGYTPEQRREFRKQHLQMRFYKVNEEFMSDANPDWLAIKNCMIDEK